MATESLKGSVLSTDQAMGKILTTLTITNRADQILATRQVIPASEIRSIELQDVLVDTYWCNDPLFAV